MTEPIKDKTSIWTQLSKFFGLFILVYLFLYMFPFPLSEIPIIGEVFSYYHDAIEALTIWLGENILGLGTVEKIEMTGSGDTTFDFVMLFTTAIISLFISLIIFVLTITKSNYNKLFKFVRTYARYYLALYLLIYGFVKFYDGQFIFPGTYRLEQKFGDSSPMGLLWTFMGYSKSYTMFGGICEVLAGTLLFFKRTSVLGGLVSLLVMTNVAMLNFSYDVPVKLFSLHLVLISIFIISPNLINLFHLFFLKKTVSLKIERSELKNKWLKYGRLAIKSMVIVGFPLLFIYSNTSSRPEKANHELDVAFYTREFIKNNDTLSRTQRNWDRWDKFYINDDNVTIIFHNKTEFFCKADIDTSAHIIDLTPNSDPNKTYSLRYHFTKNKMFNLSGQFLSDSISATFKIKRPKEYELVNRGFHWINEYPHNR